MEEIATPNSSNNINPTNNNPRGQQMLERRARPQKDQNLYCPRCNSTNTKFCYYNNYSLTQPRYFCKTCRSTAAPQNPKFLEGQDLNLAFPIQGIFHPMEHHHHHHHQFPKIEGTNSTNNENIHGNIPTTTAITTTNASCGGNSSTPLSALELLRTGIASRGSLGSFLPMPMAMVDSSTIYPSSALMPNLQEFKPNMGSSVLQSRSDNPPHHDNHHGSDNNMMGSGASTNGGGGGARLLFPFADMNKLASSTTTTTTEHHEADDQSRTRNDDHHHHNNNHHQGPTGYWTGMLGGGAW
ncbi:hypothetical protein Cgig2_030366 [Carnegiea gigantea]|uniref:Dof zinc finger protein n=1 Tax=Carnegiea gigantea TaxID=171969 RepID=A0A9Q1KL72_9CARY|nr:hypothetical protein Cgig2_030366 [Carnegiea gigantea]